MLLRSRSIVLRQEETKDQVTAKRRRRSDWPVPSPSADVCAPTYDWWPWRQGPQGLAKTIQDMHTHSPTYTVRTSQRHEQKETRNQFWRVRHAGRTATNERPACPSVFFVAVAQHNKEEKRQTKREFASPRLWSITSQKGSLSIDSAIGLRMRCGRAGLRCGSLSHFGMPMQVTTNVRMARLAAHVS